MKKLLEQTSTARATFECIIRKNSKALILLCIFLSNETIVPNQNYSSDIEIDSSHYMKKEDKLIDLTI